MLTPYGRYRIGYFVGRVSADVMLIVFLVGGGFIGKLLGNKIPFMNAIPTWINIVIGSVICGAVFLLIFALLLIKLDKSVGRRTHVLIIPIKYDGAVKAASDRLAAELNAAGIDTLLDDRNKRSGVKFDNAHFGIPWLVVVSDKGLAQPTPQVEVKRSSEKETRMVELDKVYDVVSYDVAVTLRCQAFNSVDLYGNPVELYRN